MKDDIYLPSKFARSAELAEDPLAQAQLNEEGEVFKAPCLLLFDTSGSMSGCINQLNDAAQRMQTALKDSPDMRNIVEVAVVEFGRPGAEVVCDFTAGRDLNLPAFTAGGLTPMGEAISLGLKLLKKRTEAYKQAGKHVYKPFIFLYTDGGPNDDGWEDAREVLLENQRRRKINFFPFATDGADEGVLATFHHASTIYRIREGGDLSSFFQFVTDSMSSLMSSRPGETNLALSLPRDVQQVRIDV